MPKKLPEFTVIRDTREKENNGWLFSEEDKRPGICRVLGTEETTIDAGDYTIKGYEDVIRIERKNGFAEIFGNYSPVENKERFEREMEKLSKIPHKYILVETTLSKDALSLAVPQYKNPCPSRRVYSWLMQLTMDYGIQIMFVGDTGKQTARIIFENIVRKYSD